VSSTTTRWQTVARGGASRRARRRMQARVKGSFDLTVRVSLHDGKRDGTVPRAKGEQRTVRRPRARTTPAAASRSSFAATARCSVSGCCFASADARRSPRSSPPARAASAEPPRRAGPDVRCRIGGICQLGSVAVGSRADSERLVRRGALVTGWCRRTGNRKMVPEPPGRMGTSGATGCAEVPEEEETEPADARARRIPAGQNAMPTGARRHLRPRDDREARRLR